MMKCNKSREKACYSRREAGVQSPRMANHCRLWTIGAILLVAKLLTACTTQMTPSVDPSLLTQSWFADGILGYNENGKGFSANYYWQNTAQKYHIQLIGPLGAWRAMLSGDKHSAALTMSDGRVFHAKDAGTLMQENLGWSIPVIDLRYWFLGLPNPAMKYKIQRTANGDMQQIQQAGWIIDYSEHRTRLVLTQGQKKITVIIEHFSTDEGRRS